MKEKHTKKVKKTKNKQQTKKKKTTTNEILNTHIGDEVHIFDGIILTLALLLFGTLNWSTFSQIPFLSLLVIQIYSAIVLVLISITIKNIVVYRNEIQISIALILTIVFSGLALFFQKNQVSYSIFTVYCIIFAYIFLRNFIFKLQKKKELFW